jgi:ATPase complex subunit ATP10
VRSLLVRTFKGRLRRSMPEEQWERYFMVKLARDVGRGLTEDVRDAMGFLNSQIGYVYLLDTECRIRWAGSGHAWKGEVEGLNVGIRRLLEEARVGKKVESKSKSRISMPKESRPAEIERERDLEKAIA